MRYLAIDYGSKRTGLAICDFAEIIASPLTILDSRKNLLEKIADVAAEENVDAVIVGLPLNMDGSAGSQAQLVRKFADQLKSRLQNPIHFQDERLSSFAAEEKLAAIEYKGKKKAKRLDAIAAAEILQAFLEEKNTN